MQVHDIEDEINFTIRGSDMITEIFEEYSPAQMAGIGGLVWNISYSLGIYCVIVTFYSQSAVRRIKIGRHL